MTITATDNQMNDEAIKSVRVTAWRWFQASYGNTYFTAKIYVNGAHVATIGETYGYGNHYETVAAKWLESAGYMNGREHHANGSAEPAWRYFQDRGIAFESDAKDVKRRRDMLGAIA